jgi:hypothetical protein
VNPESPWNWPCIYNVHNKGENKNLILASRPTTICRVWLIQSNVTQNFVNTGYWNRRKNTPRMAILQKSTKFLLSFTVGRQTQKQIPLCESTCIHPLLLACSCFVSEKGHATGNPPQHTHNLKSPMLNDSTAFGCETQYCITRWRPSDILGLKLPACNGLWSLLSKLKYPVNNASTLLSYPCTRTSPIMQGLPPPMHPREFMACK